MLADDDAAYNETARTQLGGLVETLWCKQKQIAEVYGEVRTDGCKYTRDFGDRYGIQESVGGLKNN